MEKKKDRRKTNLTTRLSFGVGDVITGENAETLEDKKFTASKIKVRRDKVTTKFQRGISFESLPGRLTESYGERPIYSKEYLNELKNATPVSRQKSSSSPEPEEILDESDIHQLRGVPGTNSDNSIKAIPTDAEIREKKERRARLAREADFISFDESTKDHYALLLSRNKKKETRLVPDDEDFAEGFDEFVEDDHISLGKKQERQARRHKREKIAEMIEQAERDSDSVSDDSEAERCAAYENAQTRAGMDGLSKHGLEDDHMTTQMPARITPLPSLSECLISLQNTLNSMEVELDRKRRELVCSEKEEQDIEQREVELQALLKQTGERLEVIKSGNLVATETVQDTVALASDSVVSSMMVDRGLESFGEDNK